VLERLAAAPGPLAERALRRHALWRQVEASGANGARHLRRAWERARDEALGALDAPNGGPPPS
jgi:hypothetical protein